MYYNGELLAESWQDETVTSRYILGYGVASGWHKEKEGYHPYHLDEQNSTAYITDAGQQIENSYQYDAFGIIRGRDERIHNRILYTGQQHDQVTRQYYLRARYYNPVVGRFLQEDVYRGDGLNLYAYCENNPVVYYDPSGYALEPISYIGSEHLYPVMGKQKNTVKIKLTGNRDSDFTAAFKAAGITRNELKKILQSIHGIMSTILIQKLV